MDLADKVIVVTGGGSGIGAALCHRFAEESPRSITIIDLGLDGAEQISDQIRLANPGVQAHGVAVDVSHEDQLTAALDAIAQREGTIDLFVGNAGIGSSEGVEAPDETWRRVIDVNLMAHVYASRALLPAWLERGYGRMIITASAAGLLTNIGDAPYSVTKHGAVALAEWLSVTYGDRGVTVSCLCPQGVRTPLLFPELSRDGSGSAPAGGELLALEVVRAQRILEPSDVAESVMEALGDDRFLILPHEEVALYEQARSGNREKWLRSMRRLQAQIDGRTSAGD